MPRSPRNRHLARNRQTRVAVSISPRINEMPRNRQLATETSKAVCLRCRQGRGGCSGSSRTSWRCATERPRHRGTCGTCGPALLARAAWRRARRRTDTDLAGYQADLLAVRRKDGQASLGWPSDERGEGGEGLLRLPLPARLLAPRSRRAARVAARGEAASANHPDARGGAQDHRGAGHADAAGGPGPRDPRDFLRDRHPRGRARASSASRRRHPGAAAAGRDGERSAATETSR